MAELASATQHSSWDIVVPPKLAKALLSVQREVAKISVTKNATNPHFGNKYADLPSVLDAVIPVLNEHGIAVIQLPVVPPFPNFLALSTTLVHESGESVSGVLVVPLEKANSQGIGSAITYARRYSLASVVGLKTEDDDGEAAVDHANESQETPVRTGLGPFRRPKFQPQSVAGAPKRGKTRLFPAVEVR